MGILIDKTSDCPYVNFNDDGLLEVEGRSISEDVFSFWQPLIDWVKNYVRKPAEVTRAIFFLEYSNSSTNKYLSEMMKLLDKCADDGNKVEITWKYEEDDESILVLGQDLESLIKLPLDYQPVEMEKQKTRKMKIKSKKSGSEAIITFRYWEAIVRNGHGGEYTIVEEY
ncbi:MAG TPA: DUF1987 domain-containing protein [Tenuifilaceae bacterium]|nr:DUF1987 domain-containing protein [Tenuifilaceae bacterium]